MCVVSMVFDHYRERFPSWPVYPAPWTTPVPMVPTPPVAPTIQPWEIQQLRDLIREFREALGAAKTVDRLTGQPDCEDPEKAKLLERVRRLEEALGITADADPVPS